MRLKRLGHLLDFTRESQQTRTACCYAADVKGL